MRLGSSARFRAARPRGSSRDPGGRHSPGHGSAEGPQREEPIAGNRRIARNDGRTRGRGGKGRSALHGACHVRGCSFLTTGAGKGGVGSAEDVFLPHRDPAVVTATFSRHLLCSPASKPLLLWTSHCVRVSVPTKAGKSKVVPKPLQPRNAPRRDRKTKPATRLEEVLRSGEHLFFEGIPCHQHRRRRPRRGDA